MFGRGFTVDQIRSSLATPLLLPANRALGDDGTYVSVRELSESTGIELGFVRRLVGVVGLPQIDDLDAHVLLRVDGEAVARANFFLDTGADPDTTVALMEELGHASAMMRDAALNILLRPGASEIELAQASENLARQVAPQLGPMIEDLLLRQLRRSFEVEAVTAAERAVGKLPARVISRLRSPTWRASPGWVKPCRPKSWKGSQVGSPKPPTTLRSPRCGSSSRSATR